MCFAPLWVCQRFSEVIEPKYGDWIPKKSKNSLGLPYLSAIGRPGPAKNSFLHALLSLFLGKDLKMWVSKGFPACRISRWNRTTNRADIKQFNYVPYLSVPNLNANMKRLLCLPDKERKYQQIKK